MFNHFHFFDFEKKKNEVIPKSPRVFLSHVWQGKISYRWIFLSLALPLESGIFFAFSIPVPQPGIHHWILAFAIFVASFVIGVGLWRSANHLKPSQRFYGKLFALSYITSPIVVGFLVGGTAWIKGPALLPPDIQAQKEIMDERVNRAKEMLERAKAGLPPLPPTQNAAP